MNGLTARLKRLEHTVNPPGTSVVDGVAMDRAQALAFFRQRTLMESGRERAAGLSQTSWRERPQIDENLSGNLWDRIKAARKRVGTASV